MKDPKRLLDGLFSFVNDRQKILSPPFFFPRNLTPILQTKRSSKKAAEPTAPTFQSPPRRGALRECRTPARNPSENDQGDNNDSMLPPSSKKKRGPSEADREQLDIGQEASAVEPIASDDVCMNDLVVIIGGTYAGKTGVVKSISQRT